MTIAEVTDRNNNDISLGDPTTVEGVVVGDFQGSDEMNGFFIQDPNGAPDSPSSNGIFVFVPEANEEFFGFDVEVGQTVEVTGEVAEFNGRRQLDFISDISILNEEINPIEPTVINFPEATDGELERFVGTLVTIPQQMTVSQNFFLGRYGQLTLSSPDENGVPGRLFQPTQFFTPGSNAANQLFSDNAERLLVLDDGQDINRFGDNPDPAPYFQELPNGGLTLRAGATTSNLVGVLDFGRINSSSDPNVDLRLQPTVEPTFQNRNPRTPEPENVGGDIKIGNFNVLNYFTTLDTEENTEPARGADNAEEFERQQQKIFDALIDIDADVVGLVEIENNGFGADSAIQNLVDGLNQALTEAGISDVTYDFIDPGVDQIGIDAITNALIYNTQTIEPVGDSAILETGAFSPNNSSNNGGDGGYNRPPLAQTFSEIETGELFTVAVNHFKSKRDPDEDAEVRPGDIDSGDGAAAWNLRRTEAASELVEWLETDPTGSGDPDFLITGDLNAYASEDPIQAVINGGYDNLVDIYTGNDRAYSFTFDGFAGYLDHALTTQSLTNQVTTVTEWHINTDESPLLDYNFEFKPDSQEDALFRPDAFRSSDHDPIIIGLDLGSDLTTVDLTNDDDVYVMPTGLLENRPNGLRGLSGDDRIIGSTDSELIQGNADNDTLNGEGGNDTIVGGLGADRLFGQNGNDVLEGRPGNDFLFGGNGNDLLEGGQGRDRFNGGAGNDTFTGGAGIDRFIYNTNRQFSLDDIGSDNITDFEQDRDLILLDRTTFNEITSNPGEGFSVSDEFESVETNAEAATSEAIIVYSEASGNVYYNPNGSAAGFDNGGLFVTVQSQDALSGDDFAIRA